MLVFFLAQSQRWKIVESKTSLMFVHLFHWKVKRAIKRREVWIFSSSHAFIQQQSLEKKNLQNSRRESVENGGGLLLSTLDVQTEEKRRTYVHTHTHTVTHCDGNDAISVLFSLDVTHKHLHLVQEKNNWSNSLTLHSRRDKKKKRTQPDADKTLLGGGGVQRDGSLFSFV